MNGEDEKKKDDLRLQVLEKLTTLATAAFGLVAALAWNDAIQSLFKRVFGEQSTLAAKFIYAGIVTVIIVAVTIRLGKSVNELKEKLGHNETKSDA